MKEIHELLNKLQHESISEYEFSGETVSVINALETIPEWWKEHYKIPANDERWLGLTRETALEDYTRYITKYAVDILREKYGYRRREKATIMDKSVEEMKQEIEHIRNWVSEDNEIMKGAIEKVGAEPKELEKEIFGKELTPEEKEEMVRERVMKVMREEYGMQI